MPLFRLHTSGFGPRPILLILGLGIALTLPINAHAASDGSWGEWDEARNLYDSGQFQEALVSLTAYPKPSVEYYYNLGTVYFRLNEYGKARVAFEKADRLAPYNADVNHNLKLTEEVIAEKIGRQRVDPASTWVEKLADRTTLDQVRACLALSILLAIMLWIQPYRRTRSVWGTLRQPSGILGLVALFFMVAVFGAHRLAESNPAAIAVEAHTIRSGPGEHYLLLSELEPGMKVRYTGRKTKTDDKSWLQVRYAPGNVGWIPESSVLLL